MSRVPIRVRLTAAFAAAMILVLAGAAAFVYVRLSGDLDDAIDDALKARVAAVVRTGAQPVDDPDEAFAQVISANGELVERSGPVRVAALTPAQAAAVVRGRELVAERPLAGIEGTVRLRARATSRTGTAAVALAGRSLDDRDETLRNLVVSFAIGGPLAVLLASLLGYGLAASALRPVEAMRSRAEQISLLEADDRLPLPQADDEIRRLGETLNAMLARLGRAFERERRFVADASHELRTPIAVIRTEIDAALLAGGHTPAARESLVAALEECDRLTQLADDLLVLAREGEDGVPLQRERLAASELLEGVRERFASRAAERGRRLVVDAPAGLVIDADPIRLRQALGNLVDNALRHGAGDVSLSATRGPHGARVTVRDEGAGFTAEMAERAFERFTRGDAGRAGDGAGLGLAIVSAIARAHGGEARIEPGPGGCVVLELPGGMED